MSKIKKSKIKVKRKIYSIDDLKKALEEVKKGASIHAASATFNVPYSTLHSKVKEPDKLDVKPGPNSILSHNEEKEIVQWILNSSKCGFPVTKEHLLDSVQMIVKITNRNTPFTNGRPSRHWYEAFLKRNPEVSKEIYKNFRKSRVSITEQNLKEWFTQVQNYLISKNLEDIGPDRIFNLTESSFILNPDDDKVFVHKGEKTNVNNKECLTALIGGNAAGHLLPIIIIYNNEKISKSISKHFPDDFVIEKSETGWITSETFNSYIVNHLYHWCVKNNITFPIVLYVDGQRSHLTKTLSDFCHNHKIELISFVSNATHVIQPMTVALFNPLKVAYRDEIKNWRTKNNDQQLTKVCFPNVLKNALYSLDLSKIFENGFAACGLFPFSYDSIDYSKLKKFSDTNEIDKINIQQEKAVKNKTDSLSFQGALNSVKVRIPPDNMEQLDSNAFEDWPGIPEDHECNANVHQDDQKATSDKNNSHFLVINELTIDKTGFADILSQDTSNEYADDSIIIMNRVETHENGINTSITSSEQVKVNKLANINDYTNDNKILSFVVNADFIKNNSCNIHFNHKCSDDTSTKNLDLKRVVYIIQSKLFKNVSIKKSNSKVSVFLSK